MQKFTQSLFTRLQNAITHAANWQDTLGLSLFACLITFNPYFLWGKINTFELGIYLPGINAILDGQLPYRDFFYLRGPFEIYVPALLMHWFGETVSVLSSYFYVGTVLTLIICIIIAKEIYKSRLVLYLMSLVLIARTFPRVVFTFWGGMRYVLGLLTLLLIIHYIKKQKKILIFFAGVFSALAFFTSIDIGICAFGCSALTFFFLLFFHKKALKPLWQDALLYLGGLFIVTLPYLFYLSVNQSLFPFIDSTFSVATKMMRTFPDHLVEQQPRNILEAIQAMIPNHPHFKHLTPAYCYLFLFLFLGWKLKKKEFTEKDLPVIPLAAYGFLVYIFAFRKIGASNFEMALQPEKILLFYMLQETLLILWGKRSSLISTLKGSVVRKIKTKARIRIYGIYLLIFLFIGSSAGYAIQRYNHRFFAFKYLMAAIRGKDTDALKPLHDQKSRSLPLKRVNGFKVPARQAQNIEKISEFVQKNTSKEEPVFMFPELGSYHFIVDRPFIGRFPMVSFAWIDDEWHEQLFEELKKKKPRYAILSKEKDIQHLKVFFQIKRNKEKYYQIINYIREHYTLTSTTPDMKIYQHDETVSENKE